MSRFENLARLLLGTAAYMTPEQARGEAANRRSDIWAFGCVLFEMLTGAFACDGVTETISIVLKTEPAWDRLPRGVAPTVALYLRRWLTRDARSRLQHIGDLRLALDGAFDPPAVTRVRQGDDGEGLTPCSFWKCKIHLHFHFHWIEGEWLVTIR